MTKIFKKLKPVRVVITDPNKGEKHTFVGSSVTVALHTTFDGTEEMNAVSHNGLVSINNASHSMKVIDYKMKKVKKKSKK